MKVTKSNPFVSTLGMWAWLCQPGRNENPIPESRVGSGEAIDRQRLEQRLGEIQRSARCVWRAVRLMLFLTALAVAGLGHSTVLIADWPQTMRQFVMLLPIKAHCALGLASSSCAMAFAALGLLYHRELAGLRQECRRLARADEPRLIPLPAGRQWTEEPRPVKQAA